MPELQPYLGPLAILETQEDFPGGDLTNDNADLLKLLLEDSPEIEAHARYLENHQRSIHALVQTALTSDHYQMVESTEDFQAFTRGFATFEAIVAVIKPNPQFNYDTKPGTRRVQSLFLHQDSGAKRNLTVQYEEWPNTRPNIYDTVISISEKREKTLKELRMRAMGAHFSFELHRPTLDIAS